MKSGIPNGVPYVSHCWETIQQLVECLFPESSRLTEEMAKGWLKGGHLIEFVLRRLLLNPPQERFEALPFSRIILFQCRKRQTFSVKQNFSVGPGYHNVLEIASVSPAFMAIFGDVVVPSDSVPSILGEHLLIVPKSHEYIGSLLKEKLPCAIEVSLEEVYRTLLDADRNQDYRHCFYVLSPDGQRHAVIAVCKEDGWSFDSYPVPFGNQIELEPGCIIVTKWFPWDPIESSFARDRAGGPPSLVGDDGAN